MESLEAFWAGLRPDPVFTVSSWADEYRFLASEASGEPGRWRTSRTPYLREIMDCLSPSSPVERTAFMKGAQIGGTEAGMCWLGFVMHMAPGPMLMVQPTDEAVMRASRQRIDPMIEKCPALRKLIKSPRERDSGNTARMKEFPGGFLVLTGASSPVGLRSMPVRYLFLDEVDGYDADVGGEGDPVSLAIKRTATFANRKIFMVSTPTIRGFSRIEAAYLESDQRRYWVPCPACDTFQVLVWANIRWPEGQRHLAYYECPHCHAHDYQKTTLLARGEWRPDQPGAGNGKVAGFHLSSLYSPHGWASWGEIAVEHGHVYRDKPRLKTWINTQLGETWEEESDHLNSDGLLANREDFGSLLPEAGVDMKV